MNRRRNMLLAAVAAVLAALLVYGIGEMQTIRMEREEMAYVVVPSRFVGSGERLAAGDLAYRLVPRDAYGDETFGSIEAVEGMEALIPLGENEPILSWKVDRYNLLPGPDESTFQIPKEYIRSISNGIRAGDQVAVYLSGGETSSERLFAETVQVASVKTSSNVEIEDPDDSHLLSLAEGDKERMYATRRDANGMIDYINLNLTEEQWLAIDTACKDGLRKIVIAFSPESMAVGGQKEADAP